MASKKKYPPGPSILAAAKEFTRNPCANLQNLVNHYGNICKAPGPLGYYLLNHPDYIEYVLKVNHKNYIKTDLAYQGIASVLGKNLLTTPDYDTWLVERKLLQPLFYHHHLAQYANFITETTQQLCQRWHQLAKQQQPINLIPEMFNLLFNIVSKTIFSGDFAEYTKEFLQFIDLGNGYIGKALFLFSWLPTPHTLRFKKNKRSTNKIVADILNKRRNSPRGTLESDLIAILLAAQQQQINPALTEQYLIDEIKTFIVTGTETTATALSWLWYCLATNPDANDSLQQELTTQLGGKIPTLAEAEALSYTRMVFEETLRLYPSLWIVSRRALTQDYIGEYFVPANKSIVISPFVTHRHPEYWTHPNRFNPLNFSEENKKKQIKYTYLPFGLGPRSCIGMIFASFEAQLIIPIIAQQFAFELLATEPVELAPLITLRPKNGIWVKLKAREL